MIKTFVRISPYLMLFFPITFFAQGPDTLWTRVLGGSGDDVAYSATETSDGFYLVAGYTGFGAAGLVKLDQNGDTVWTKAFGGGGYDGAHGVVEASDGGYIIAGFTESFGNGGKDLYLVKTDSDGNLVWSKTYGGQFQDVGYGICAVPDGYTVCGYRDGPAEWIKGDLWILKIDESGDTLWTARYGGAGEDYGITIRALLKSNNGYIISASTASFGSGGKDAWLLRVAENGDTLWTKTFGNAAEDVGYGVNLAHDEGFVVTGYVDGTGEWTPGDLWIIKTDNEGNEEWMKTYTTAGENFGFGISSTTDGGYIVAGQIGLNSGDLCLLKTTSDGDTVWTRSYGNAALNSALAFCLTSDGGYLAAGLSMVSDHPNYYLVKTRPILNLLSPNGGEVLAPGSSYQIEWGFENSPKPPYSLRLLYSKSGEYADTIETGIAPNLSSFTWSVPFDTSDECRIKIELLTGEGEVLASDESDGYFSIENTGVYEGKDPFVLGLKHDPVSRRTLISYSLSKAEKVSISVFNSLGSRVSSLVNHYEPEGLHTVSWDGSALASGVYFLRIEIDGSTQATRTLVML